MLSGKERKGKVGQDGWMDGWNDAICGQVDLGAWKISTSGESVRASYIAS